MSAFVAMPACHRYYALALRLQEVPKSIAPSLGLARARGPVQKAILGERDHGFAQRRLDSVPNIGRMTAPFVVGPVA
ncbi:MAG TPA: hypothetical protein VMF89_04545, partial [Polyangiales bacterium]|nr:hypothetical protein [Polyangiales bacterium]